MKKAIDLGLFLLVNLFFIHQAYAVNYLASDLLGQLDGSNNPVYTSAAPNTGTTTLSFPNGVLVDSVHHRLFVCDAFNYRVLVFNLDSQNNLIDRVADYVLGQSNFNTSSSATTQSGLNIPAGLAYDANTNKLFVPDLANRRVLIYDVTSITNGENAIGVLGQSTFTSSTLTLSQTGMQDPALGTFDDRTNLLYIPDVTHNRLLIFDVATTTNGEAAIGVLGQPDFVSSSSAATQNGLNAPQMGALDRATNRLFLTDRGNNRVLIFDVATTTNGEAAIGVLGQPDFTTHTATTTQFGLNTPTGLTYDTSTNLLFVSDSGNNRIMIFDVATTTNGEAAVNVLGQPNFTSSSAATTQGGMGFTTGMDFDPDNRRLYITDGLNNNRILIYDFVRITNSSFSIGTVGNSYNPTISVVNNQGTTTISVVSGTVPSGLNSVLSGTPTTMGLYTFTLRATDAFPSGNLIFDKQYAILIAPPGATPVLVPAAPSMSSGIHSPSPSQSEETIDSSSTATSTLAGEDLTEADSDLNTESQSTGGAPVRVLQLKLIDLLGQLLILLQKLLASR